MASSGPPRRPMRRQGLPKRHAAFGHRRPRGGGQGLRAAAAAEKPATPGERLGRSGGFVGASKTEDPLKTMSFPWVLLYSLWYKMVYFRMRLPCFRKPPFHGDGTKRWKYNWDIYIYIDWHNYSD